MEKREEEAARENASVSFGDFADEFIKDHEAGWSNPKHIAQWHMTLSDSYYKKIRSQSGWVLSVAREGGLPGPRC